MHPRLPGPLEDCQNPGVRYEDKLPTSPDSGFPNKTVPLTDIPGEPEAALATPKNRLLKSARAGASPHISLLVPLEKNIICGRDRWWQTESRGGDG